MTENALHFRKIRLIIDCVFLLAIILVIIASRQPTQVNAEFQAQANLTEGSLELHTQDQVLIPSYATDVVSNMVTLDNNTIAAIIAAENAALTPPQIMTVIPIINR